MKIEEAFDRLRECLSGARFVEGLEAMDVIRSHLEAKVVVDDAMVSRALSAWREAGLESARIGVRGKNKARDWMKQAIQAAVGEEDAKPEK